MLAFRPDGTHESARSTYPVYGRDKGKNASGHSVELLRREHIATIGPAIILKTDGEEVDADSSLFGKSELPPPTLLLVIYS